MDTPIDRSEHAYVYKTVGGQALSLAFLPPLTPRYERAPVYFIIPGGGWNSAVKEAMLDFSALSVDILRRQGFAVASTEYRIFERDRVTLTSIVSDVMDAGRYLARHAETLGIDPSRFATSGHSAGGHLALMMACAPHDRFTADSVLDADFQVFATAPLSAPIALQPPQGGGAPYAFPAPVADAQEAAFCSPFSWTDSAPPAFVAYGTHDPLVLPENSTAFAARCRRAVTVAAQYGGHCFEPMVEGKAVSPDHPAIQRLLAGFIQDEYSRL